MGDIDSRLYYLFSCCQQRGLPLDELLFADGLIGKHTLAAKLESQPRELNEPSGPSDEQPA
jgi:hypothetical protein